MTDAEYQRVNRWLNTLDPEGRACLRLLLVRAAETSSAAFEAYAEERDMPAPGLARGRPAAGGGRDREHPIPCRSCGAAIWFKANPAGKFVPMNVEMDGDGNEVSHFATCPQAKQWSGRGRR